MKSEEQEKQKSWQGKRRYNDNCGIFLIEGFVTAATFETVFSFTKTSILL